MKWIEESIESAFKDANPITKLIIKDAYNDRKKIFYTIVTTLLLMILSSAFTSKLFCYLKLDVLMLQLKENSDLGIGLVITYAFFIAYKVVYIRLLDRGLLPTILSIFRLVGLLLLYFCFIRSQFELSSHFCFYRILGTDIFVFFSSLLFLDFKPFKQFPEQSLGEGFYSDSSNNSKSADSFSRKHIAIEIAKIVNNTYPKESFAIGVIGEWGYGKTTFINFVFEELKGNPDNIIIRFHPWKPNDRPQIIREFYSQLISVVDKIDSQLSRSISLYADRLVGSDSDTIGLIKNIIANLSGNTDSIEYYFQLIKSSIENSGKKFIVFVDDLDRLSGEEILDILKIIRGTAQFPNFFFISGYDLTYLREAMGKSNQIAFEQEYLQKIFQLEFVLPPISYDMLMQSLKKMLTEDSVFSKWELEIYSTFKSLTNETSILFNRDTDDEFIERENVLIKNYRDIVRILNSLKISLSLVGESIVVKDLVIIEILKNKYPELYFEFSTKGDLFSLSYSDISGIPKSLLNENRIKVSISKFNNLKNKGVESVVKNLFYKTSLGDKDFNFNDARLAIGWDNNHKVYFQYLNQNRIYPTEVKQFLSSDFNSRVKFIDKLAIENNIIGIEYLFRMGFEPKNQKELERDLLTFVYASHFLDSLALRAVGLIKEFIDRNSDDAHVSVELVINKVISDNLIKPHHKGVFIFELIRTIVKKESYKLDVFSSEYLAKLKNDALDLFKNHLAQSNGINYSTFRFYYNNLDMIQNNKIFLTADASTIYRQFIYKHQYDYIVLLLRPLYTPPDTYYTFEPFIPQTFDENPDEPYKKFEQFLNESVEAQKLDEMDLILNIFNRFKQNSFDRVELSPEEIIKIKRIQEPYLLND